VAGLVVVGVEVEDGKGDERERTRGWESVIILVVVEGVWYRGRV
jgi:hypothetical protein